MLIKKILAASALPVILAITGCSQGGTKSNNDGSFYERHKRAIGGAIAGAVGGGVIGHQSGRKEKGAVIGALAGLGVGAYMDKQAAELKSELSGSGVTVTRNGDNIVLNMPENITFDFAKSELKPRFYATLNDVARIVNKYDKTALHIAGHTDNIGGHAYNQGLSERRAGSVSAYLTGQRVNSARLVTYGYGKTRPIATNQTDAGRAQNRRVEITISPS